MPDNTEGVAVHIPEGSLERHCCVFGATGTGKSRLSLWLAKKQMREGCSLVALDPKMETVNLLMAAAMEAGVRADCVTVVDPANLDFVPGWNPLSKDTGLPPAQRASDFVSVLAAGSESWGPRLQDILMSALIVLAVRNKSLDLLNRFLADAGCREDLIGDGNGDGSTAWESSADFFAGEYGRWSESRQAEAAAPVANKVRELVRNPFFNAFLCAGRNTLRLESLWKTQGVVLVHLDRVSLGDEGARILGGFMAQYLLRTAMRTEGPRSVALMVDEMGMQERFLGKALQDILAIARSRKLRLLMASQHIDQLSGSLKSALLGNCAVQAFFRLGWEDARAVAPALAGTGGLPELKDPEPPPPPKPKPKTIERRERVGWKRWRKGWQNPDGWDNEQDMKVTDANRKTVFFHRHRLPLKEGKTQAVIPASELAAALRWAVADPSTGSLHAYRDIEDDDFDKMDELGRSPIIGHELVPIEKWAGQLSEGGEVWLGYFSSGTGPSPLQKLRGKRESGWVSLLRRQPVYGTVVEELPPDPEPEPAPEPPKPAPYVYVPPPPDRQQWESILMGLKNRQCVLRIAGFAPKITEVPSIDPDASFSALFYYRMAAGKANGRTAALSRQERAGRRREVEEAAALKEEARRRETEALAERAEAAEAARRAARQKAKPEPKAPPEKKYPETKEVKFIEIDDAWP